MTPERLAEIGCRIKVRSSVDERARWYERDVPELLAEVWSLKEAERGWSEDDRQWREALAIQEGRLRQKDEALDAISRSNDIYTAANLAREALQAEPAKRCA